MPLLDGQGRADEGLGVDAHEHEPVAQPLLHPHAEQGRDLPDRGAQRLQLGHGAVVPVLVDEVGEAAQVDEGERAVDAVIGGDGGQLSGVHGTPRGTDASIGRRRDPVRADCDNVHMMVMRAPSYVGEYPQHAA